MRKVSVSAISIYGVIVTSSLAISIANLAGSLRVLDITGSAIYLSIAVTSYNIAYTLMSWGWTWLFFGRFSRKDIILVSLSGLVIGLIMMALGSNVVVVIAGTTLVGLFSAVLSPLLTTLLTDYIGRDTPAVTRYNIFSSIGLMLGYLLAGILRPVVGTDSILALTSLIVAVLIPLTLLIPQKYIVIEPRRLTYISLIPQFTGRLRPLPSTIFSPEIVYNMRRLLRDFHRMIRERLVRKLPVLLLSTGILFTGISVFFTPMPAFLRYLGFSDEELYMTYLYSTIVSSLSYIAVHKYLHKSIYAWKPLILSTAVRVAIFLSPLPLLYVHTEKLLNLVAVETIFTLIGITWAYISTSLPVLTLSLSETEKRDVRLGHLNASIGLGTIMGSIIAGVVYEGFGYVGILVSASTLVGLSVALYYKAWKALVT